MYINIIDRINQALSIDTPDEQLPDRIRFDISAANPCWD